MLILMKGPVLHFRKGPLGVNKNGGYIVEDVDLYKKMSRIRIVL